MRDLAQPATRPGQNAQPVWLLALTATIGALLIVAAVAWLAHPEPGPSPTPATSLLET